MRRAHFNYLCLMLLALGLACLWAQDDTPIVISDGSLTLDSAVPWPSFTNAGANTKAHPQPNKSVTLVAIAMPGNNRTINFSGQRCTVRVTYAGADLTFATNPAGRALTVTTDFSKLRRGASDNQLVHTTTNQKISRVVVMQDSATVFDNTASGGTRITISYR